MVYPGYQLNPGDMFQVEPDRVMFATGASKDASERRAGRKARQKQKESSTTEQDKTSSSETPTPASEQPPPDSNTESQENTKENLQSLLTQAKSLLNSSSPASSLSGKRKQDLRAFQRLLRKTLSRTHLFPQQATTLTDSLDAQLQELTQKLNLNPSEHPSSQQSRKVEEAERGGKQGTEMNLTPENSKLLRQALEEARDNPIDVTKPYATPWRPRPYMSAFAFIPRYLEVHHKICSAVYLRHPVARPGLGEVPTPFGNDVNSLAFNWYLRRR